MNATVKLAHILIVDDTEAGRDVLSSLLVSQQHALSLAASGPEALDLAVQNTPDIILLDIMMPGMDGFEVCQRMRAMTQFSDVTILMVTALDDRESRIRGIEVGADDFISKPFDRTELRTRINTIARLNRYRRLHAERLKFSQLVEHSPDGILIINPQGEILLANPATQKLFAADETTLIGQQLTEFIAIADRSLFEKTLNNLTNHPESNLRLEVELTSKNQNTIPTEITLGGIEWEAQNAVQLIVRDVTERNQAIKQIDKANHDLTIAYDATLEGWARALELRDLETKGHSDRVTRMAVDLMRLMGFSQLDLVQVRRGALLHDIGKLAIPDSILLKPGPLTDDEMEVMRKHTLYARDMLLKIPYLHPAIDIPFCHHEKWDGTGYPRKLSGEEIPLAARLFSMIDVYDALNSDRPYRSAWPIERIRSYIQEQAGSAFQPKLVEIFLQYTAGYMA